jgi:hypothetical protein
MSPEEVAKEREEILGPVVVAVVLSNNAPFVADASVT